MVIADYLSENPWLSGVATKYVDMHHPKCFSFWLIVKTKIKKEKYKEKERNKER
jgi:CRISPR/Cas system endoribonuclease Cas6 (RAMP superfamily)